MAVPTESPTPAVHPRVCGERDVSPLIPSAVVGSSPRVRGTGPHPHPFLREERFIPACAGNGAAARARASVTAVHPRVCGERRFSCTYSGAGSGSSPRVRGTDGWSRQAIGHSRFIPACAGNGPKTWPSSSPSSVHPRVCGERELLGGGGHGCSGSSPRVRGTVRADPLRSEGPRFIPACAGNGLHPVDVCPDASVHPRVCGERIIRETNQVETLGSSPRVRGTAGDRIPPRLHHRFIPACAGNGIRTSAGSPSEAVHPRVCGERASSVEIGIAYSGSSPRVRGTDIVGGVAADGDRFIPACAGNGRSGLILHLISAVHPRVCGERFVGGNPELLGGGSSPRVRGTGCSREIGTATSWFIPACAGNGIPRKLRREVDSVHPRVCGERREITTSADNPRGSSPRVRGTDLPVRHREIEGRFIPACAGNGLSRWIRCRPPTVHPRVCGERGGDGDILGNHDGSSPRVRGTGHNIHRTPTGVRFIPACAGNGGQSGQKRG